MERNNLSKLKFVFKGIFKSLKQMCVLCLLEWILFSGKEGQKYFVSLALNNDKFLYENEFKAFDIYKIEKQRFGPVFS